MKTSRPGSRKPSKPSPSCDPYGNPLQSPSKQNYRSSIQMSKQYCYMAQKPGKSPPTSPRRSRPSLTNVSGGSSILSGSTECQTPSCGQGRSRNQWSSRSGEEWRWIGHTLRKEPSNITRQALEWNPQGKRKRGRPKQTWRRSLHSELGTSNLTWETAKMQAKDRRRWKMTIEALCSTRSKED